MRARILLLPLAAALALPALAVPASAAGHGRAASTVVSHAVPGATADHVKALATYWTPQRMREAIRNSQAAAADTPASIPANAAPATKHSAGGPPRILARPRAAASGRARPDTVGISAAQGLVLFTAPNGQNFSCSGGAVNGTYGDMVFTAGHCVYDGGWVSNWTYVPGYDGTAPYGFYTSFNLTTFAGWTDSQDYSYDVAIASVTNGSGTALADATGANGANGANGIIWNSGYLNTVMFSGYPGGQFATCGNVLATQYLLFARLYVACDLGPGARVTTARQASDSSTAWTAWATVPSASPSVRTSATMSARSTRAPKASDPRGQTGTAAGAQRTSRASAAALASAPGSAVPDLSHRFDRAAAWAGRYRPAARRDAVR